MTILNSRPFTRISYTRIEVRCGVLPPAFTCLIGSSNSTRRSGRREMTIRKFVFGLFYANWPIARPPKTTDFGSRPGASSVSRLPSTRTSTRTDASSQRMRCVIASTATSSVRPSEYIRATTAYAAAMRSTWTESDSTTTTCKFMPSAPRSRSSANLWTEAGLGNGAYGKIASILKPTDNRQAGVVIADFPNYCGPALSPLHLLSHGSSDHAGSVSNNKGLLLLTLAWSITIHKAQIMTMKRVTIDLGPKVFVSGLAFVVLSRAKTFGGLRLFPFDLDRYRRVESEKYVEERNIRV